MRSPTKHDRKREQVLVEAASEFNARGVSGASIAAIARRVGLTRAAVYYYVADRETLACETYASACDRTRADVLAARSRERDGLSRLLAFVSLSLDPERSPPAVLSEMACLPAAQGAEIRARHDANVAALQGFIDAGMRDGSVRACDSEVAAQAIVGMLAWAPLSEHWVAPGGPGHGYRQRVQEAVLDLVRGGIAARPEEPVACPTSINTFEAPAANPFDRREAARAKIETLLRIACRRFNVKGIDGTSLEEIAAELGTTKGALYHYFRDKRALVAACYRRSFDLHDRFAATAREVGRNGLERGMIGVHLNTQGLAGPLSPLMPQVGINAFPVRLRREFTARARALKQTFDGFGAEGLADGSCRPCDLSVISLIGAGAFGWLPKWLEPGDPRTPQAIADEIVALFVAGLGRR